MKIALYNVTTTTLTGGVETFVWELARQLASQYPDCTIDIIGGKPASNFNLPPTPRGVRVFTRAFIKRERLRQLPLMRRLYAFTKLLERLSFNLTTLRLMQRQKYDIIHIQKPYDLPFARLVNWLFGTKILFGCHGKDFFVGDKLFANWFNHPLPAVSCSHYNADIIQARYNIKPQVVYNGIDVELFSPQPPDAALRAKYAKSDEFVVMQVGRQVRWKGAQYLIEAAALLQNQASIPIKVLLAGNGDYQGKLGALAERLGIAERVHFLGNVAYQDMPRYYAICDAVVGTSFANETFGIALCEAAACAKPVVASDFGGFREVVLAGVTGLFYPPQNSNELANQLADLYHHPTKGTEFGKAGRAFVVSEFSWQAVASRVYQAYLAL